MEKVALVGVIAVIAANMFKSGKTEYGLMISFAGCILIFYFSMGKLQSILNSIEKIRSYLSVNSEYISILLKIIGITYIAELASNLCKDAGHAAIGNQIELAGKLCIMAISMPILLALLDTIDRFLIT